MHLDHPEDIGVTMAASSPFPVCAPQLGSPPSGVIAIPTAALMQAEQSLYHTIRKLRHPSFRVRTLVANAGRRISMAACLVWYNLGSQTSHARQCPGNIPLLLISPAVTYITGGSNKRNTISSSCGEISYHVVDLSENPISRKWIKSMLSSTSLRRLLPDQLMQMPTLTQPRKVGHCYVRNCNNRTNQQLLPAKTKRMGFFQV